jgi:single-stranded-DNA-specific exonuclease
MPPFLWQDHLPQSYPADLLDLVNGSAIAAAALARRGFSTPAQAAAFLDPNLYRPSPPTDFPDLDKAVERVLLAIRRQEIIAVWGDFDVDGQTSTTTLVSGLRLLGAKVIFHIPVRSTESHGVNLPGLKDLISQGSSLVVTCDTGIGAHDAADLCRSAGVDLTITDHHSLPPNLPDAFAVINPRRLPEGHPAGSLSGVGTAFMLLREVADRLHRPEAAAVQLDLVALGLVGDLVELTGDARYMVQRGLDQIRAGNRLALTAIAASAGLDLSNTTEEQISFALAPRLNALGRLGDANEIVDFFTTTDAVKAGVMAARLDGLNIRRKLLTDQVFAAARAQVESGRLERDHAILVLHHPEWPAGILGIAASRLVELYQRPVILLNSPEGQLARGSARSVDGVDITAAIAASAPLLAGFGGHPMAAGMALPTDSIPQFWRELERTILSGSAGQPLPFLLPIDAYLAFPEIDHNLVHNLEALAPFGPGNPAFLLASRDVEIAYHRVIGRPGDHLQLTLNDPAGVSQKVVWWNGAGQELPRGKFDLAYHLHSSSYLGEPQIQVEWVGWRQVEAPVIQLIPEQKRAWMDYRTSLDPAGDLRKIMDGRPVLIWQEGAAPSPFPGVDRYQIVPVKNLVVWTCPSSWDDLSQAVDAAQPEMIHLFAQPAEPSRPAEILKRLLGLIQYAIQHYDGWIAIEKMAALTALPEPLVTLGVDLILSRAFFRLLARESGRLHFAPGASRPLPESQDLEDGFTRLAAEVTAFRALFRRTRLEEIQRKKIR